jgi:hypothetical protein
MKFSKKQKRYGLRLAGIAIVLTVWAWRLGVDEQDQDYGTRPNILSEDLGGPQADVGDGRQGVYAEGDLCRKAGIRHG